MIKIFDVSPKEFRKRTDIKDLFLWGAGRNVKACMDTFCKDRKIRAIVDNNPNKDYYIEPTTKESIKVISSSEFEKILRKEGIKNIALLLTPTFYSGDIIEQLDMEQVYDNLEVYLYFLLRNNSSGKSKYEFVSGMPKIPKIIHYCWFGKKEIPEKLKRYMETWHQKCPDYEIIRWDEKNYDISKSVYMQQAYENSAWGFVPDYARLDIIYEYGGIYLDTDVEVLNSLDPLLNTEAFIGFCGNEQINLGSGFGAVKKHELIKSMRDAYDKEVFVDENGDKNLKPCHHYQHPILYKYGFKLNNEFQLINDVALYPSEVLSPTGIGGTGNFFSENTISNHHIELSWISDNERLGLEKTKKIISNKFIYE